MFDESFVRAARIQEYSARERLDGASRAVRIRHVLPRSLARQAVALVLLLVLAFGFAIYMGVRHPYHADAGGTPPPLQVSVIPLVPDGAVPAVPAADPFAGSPAEAYRAGTDGIQFQGAERVGGFAQSEVMEAFTTIKAYISESALEPKAVTGGDVGAVRNLLDPGQLDQFEASVTRPQGDGSREATGWLVRFDPAEHLQMVGGEAGVRVDGQVSPGEDRSGALEISADHTFVYALRGPGKPDGPVSLFTVRRHLLFRFSHQDLQQRHIQVVEAQVAAGPLSCGGGVESYFRPILAGGQAVGSVLGVNPFDKHKPVGPACAPLGAPGAPASTAPASTAPASTAPAATASAGVANLSPQGPARATALTPPPTAPASRSSL